MNYLSTVLERIRRINNSVVTFSNSISSGFTEVDEVLYGGFVPGHLYLIGGPTESGKTSLLVSIVARLLNDGLLTIGVLSLRQTGEHWTERLLANLAQVPLEKIQRGKIEGEDFGRITSSTTTEKFKNLRVLSLAYLSMYDIEKVCTDLIELSQAQIIFIDGLNEIVDEESGSAKKNLHHVTTLLKTLAIKLDVPLVASINISEDNPAKDLLQPAIDANADSIFRIIAPENDVKLSIENRMFYEVILKVQKNNFGPMSSFRFKHFPAFSSLIEWDDL